MASQAEYWPSSEPGSRSARTRCGRRREGAREPTKLESAAWFSFLLASGSPFGRSTRDGGSAIRRLHPRPWVEGSPPLHLNHRPAWASGAKPRAVALDRRPGGGDFRLRRRFCASGSLRQELARLAAPARSARVVGSPTFRVSRRPGPSLQPQSSQYPHLEPVGRTLGSLGCKGLGLMVSRHVEIPTRVTPAVLGHHRAIMTRSPRETSARGAGRRQPSTPRRVSPISR